MFNKPAFRASALSIAAALLASMTPMALGEVIISEIMYNPASFEGYMPRASQGETGEPKPNRSEWVELTNVGAEAVDLAGWFLKDEDGKTAPIPAQTFIEPGQCVVLIPGDQTPAAFQQAWQAKSPVIALQGWSWDGGLANLANSPSPTNEKLQLVAADGSVKDTVNYDDNGSWPSDNPHGPSIYLLPGNFTADANDAGEAWARSEADLHGGRNAQRTQHYKDLDLGSPGEAVIEESVESTEPASPGEDAG